MAGQREESWVISMVERAKHPSGRPIRERYIKASPYRSAPAEPLTPGLRGHKIAEAIGFTVDLLSNEKRHDELFDDGTE
jgi:hypothetical protein